MVPSCITSSLIDADERTNERQDMLRRLVRRATETTPSTVTFRSYSARRAPPPPLQTVEEMWEEVIDERSGKKYYWNTISDETTGLDAKKPTTFSVIDPTMPVPTMRGDVGAPPPQRTQGRYEDGLSAESRGGAGSVVGGFGSMIAQGAAWGMGSSLGHRAIGGIFGYGGGGYPTSGGDAAGYPPSGGGDANASSPSSAYDEFDDDFDDGFGSGGDDASIFDFFSED